MENHHFNGKIHYKWPFSIAMLNYQRVYHVWDSKNNEAKPIQNPVNTWERLKAWAWYLKIEATKTLDSEPRFPC